MMTQCMKFNKLQNARRVTIEMQGIGQDVMRDMNGQSETMKSINSKIGNVSDDLSSSSSLISEMQKIRRRNKMIIYLYGGFLIILFLIIAFFIALFFIGLPFILLFCLVVFFFLLLFNTLFFDVLLFEIFIFLFDFFALLLCTFGLINILFLIDFLFPN